MGAIAVLAADVLIGHLDRSDAHHLERVQDAVAALGVDEIPIGTGAAPRLAELRAKTGCTLPDCCVLLAAEQAGPAASIATFDERLRNAAGALGIELVDAVQTAPEA